MLKKLNVLLARVTDAVTKNTTMTGAMMIVTIIVMTMNHDVSTLQEVDKDDSADLTTPSTPPMFTLSTLLMVTIAHS
jgi:hypothetical protein